jgi:hypothetical protein
LVTLSLFKRTQGGASLCPGLSHFAPLGRGHHNPIVWGQSPRDVVKLIMPKDLPDKAEGIEDPQIKRLIEKIIEAKREKKDSLDTKGM